VNNKCYLVIKLVQNTVFYKGVELWNELTLSARQLTKFNQFSITVPIYESLGKFCGPE